MKRRNADGFPVCKRCGGTGSGVQFALSSRPFGVYCIPCETPQAQRILEACDAAVKSGHRIARHCIGAFAEPGEPFRPVGAHGHVCPLGALVLGVVCQAEDAQGDEPVACTVARLLGVSSAWVWGFIDAVDQNTGTPSAGMEGHAVGVAVARALGPLLHAAPFTDQD